MDDLRNHDAKPTAHEREWMETNPVPGMMRVLTFGAIALMVGVASASVVATSSSGAASQASKVASSR
jgi:hypothetical protein